MGRAPCCDKANVKRGPWSPEEDNKLKEFIDKYGTGGNWIALPHKAGLKRCGKSCRLRWLNYLRPNIKHGEFTPEEDRIICSLYASIGSRWSIIASQLPGRTDNDIKNYWNTKLKKKLLGILPASKRKPNHHHHHQQQDHQLFQSSIASTSARNSSSFVNFNPSTRKTLLEGLQPLQIPQEIIDSSYPLLQPQMQQYQVKDSGSFLMFGGEPSCSSSDCSSTRVNCGKVTEYNFGGGGGGGGVEQMGFEAYGNGGGLGIGDKLDLSHGNGSWVGAPPLENYYDVRELVCSNDGGICLNDPSIISRNNGLKNQERVQYYY